MDSEFSLRHEGSPHKYFTQLPHLAFDLLDTVEKAVYWGACRWLYENQRKRPSQAKLAQYCGVSASSVSEAIRSFEKLGLAYVGREDGQPSDITLLDIWEVNVLTYMRRDGVLADRLTDARRLLKERAAEYANARAGKTDTPQSSKEPLEFPTVRQGERAYIKADGIDVALADVWPGVPVVGTNTTQMTQCVLNVKGTPQQIREWKDWMRKTWPRSGLTPANFLIYFPQMVEEQAAQRQTASTSPPKPDCRACHGDGFYVMRDEKKRATKTITPCDQCQVKEKAA